MLIKKKKKDEPKDKPNVGMAAPDELTHEHNETDYRYIEPPIKNIEKLSTLGYSEWLKSLTGFKFADGSKWEEMNRRWAHKPHEFVAPPEDKMHRPGSSRVTHRHYYGEALGTSPVNFGGQYPSSMYWDRLINLTSADKDNPLYGELQYHSHILLNDPAHRDAFTSSLNYEREFSYQGPYMFVPPSSFSVFALFRTFIESFTRNSLDPFFLRWVGPYPNKDGTFTFVLACNTYDVTEDGRVILNFSDPFGNCSCEPVGMPKELADMFVGRLHKVVFAKKTFQNNESIEKGLHRLIFIDPLPIPINFSDIFRFDEILEPEILSRKNEEALKERRKTPLYYASTAKRLEEAKNPTAPYDDEPYKDRLERLHQMCEDYLNDNSLSEKQKEAVKSTLAAIIVEQTELPRACVLRERSFNAFTANGPRYSLDQIAYNVYKGVLLPQAMFMDRNEYAAGYLGLKGDIPLLARYDDEPPSPYEQLFVAESGEGKSYHSVGIPRYNYTSPSILESSAFMIGADSEYVYNGRPDSTYGYHALPDELDIIPFRNWFTHDYIRVNQYQTYHGLYSNVTIWGDSEERHGWGADICGYIPLAMGDHAFAVPAWKIADLIGAHSCTPSADDDKHMCLVIHNPSSPECFSLLHTDGDHVGLLSDRPSQNFQVVVYLSSSFQAHQLPKTLLQKKYGDTVNEIVPIYRLVANHAIESTEPAGALSLMSETWRERAFWAHLAPYRKSWSIDSDVASDLGTIMKKQLISGVDEFKERYAAALGGLAALW